MSITLRIALLSALFIYFVIMFYLFRRKMLNLKYSLLWIFCGFVMLVIAIFPRLLSLMMILIGVYNPLNGLFAFIIFFVLMILMSITSIVSKQNDRNKQIIQNMALLEKRVRDIESSKKDTTLL